MSEKFLKMNFIFNQTVGTMSEKKHFISPISIDLGAKNTGVYFAHYKAGSSLDDFEKLKEDQEKGIKGVVYLLEKDDYTLLMQNRTIKRHQKRGFDRRQMVKRLFKLIWTQHFDQEWDKDTQQAISFLFNRRGFTFLTEEYDPEALEEFPVEILNHDQFPKKLRNLLNISNPSGETVNLHEEIEELSKNEKKLKDINQLFKEETKKITRPLYVIDRAKKLKEYCQKRDKNQIIKENLKDQVKLSELPKWVLKEWENRGIKKFELNKESLKNVDIVSHLNKLSSEEINKILKTIREVGEEKKLKSSIWNIKLENFNLEKSIEQLQKSPEEIQEESNKTTKTKWIQTHLQHLGFALERTYNELKSGGRHRKEYFKEIKNVLEADYSNEDSPKYLKNFCNNLKKHKSLNNESLKNLIGHLSNFELKLLRSYFNDKVHQKEDQWNEEELRAKFKHWVNNIWRVNPKKNKKKAKGEEYSYEDLKNKLKDNMNIIDFFLNTDPNLTTPPYQDNNNRHPPKCQSLILSPIFLDNKYKDWEDWLKDLEQLTTEHLEDYKEQLKSLKSSKNKSYFSQNIKNNLKQDSGKRTEKHLKTRTLQFIFDRVKKEDPLKLNEIYSYTKKLKQNIRDNKLQTEIEENKKKLQKAIEKSKLPEKLKTKPDFNKESIFEEGSFLHLIYKYYKLRQRAKDGRLFIHPEYKYIKKRGYKNTGRFKKEKHLLVYCNHKPRRKEYQTFEDLSAILQISSKALRKKIGVSDEDSDEKLIKILKEIRGLTLNCTKIAQQQKERRGFLKSHINTIYYSIATNRQKSIQTAINSIHNNSEKNKKLSSSQIKKNEKNVIKETLQELDKKNKIKEAYKLYKLCENAKNFYKEVLKKLDPDYSNKKETIEKNLKTNPAIAFYFLAQVGNIAFKERNGNANTCPVCSLDNSERMQSVSDKNNNLTTKASRLPAIPTRMFDGAIRRMSRIITKAIAEEKWTDIEKHLKNNEKVNIPIITESNQFEFEPSKENLIREKRTTRRKGKVLNRDEGLDLLDKDLTLKENRIKTNDLCPYTGKTISDGEIDHIIPRASKYGTLNDEANLIWATKKGNKQKDKTEYSLSNLNSEYKLKLFGTSSNDEIKNWIKKIIWDDKTKDFKFGKYISFINLTDDEKKAFKHALFLKGEEIRDKVIQAIDNRNRSFVNGTQRYFAEVLANELYKKAKKEKREHFLSFDYFSTPYKEIHAIREKFKKNKEYNLLNPEMTKYRKLKNKTQEPYSHLIDAQIVFISSLSNHYDKGSFKLKSDVIDVFKDYKKIKVSDKEFNKKSLERKLSKPEDTTYSNQPLFNQNSVAMRFLNLIEINLIEEEEVIYLKGFLELNELKKILELSVELLKLKENIKSDFFKKIEDQDLEKLKTLYFEKFKKVSKKNNQSFLIKNNGKEKAKIKFYTLDRQKVFNFLIDNFNTSSDLPLDEEKLSILQELTELWYFTKKEEVIKQEKNKSLKLNEQKPNKFKRADLTNPHLKSAWKNFNEQFKSKNDLTQNDIKQYFLNQKNHYAHQKVRKKFSLPIKTSKGFLIKKKNWQGNAVFYCRPASNKFSQTVLHINKNKEEDERLSNIYRQKNIFYIDDNPKNLKTILRPIDITSAIDPNKYYPAKIPNEFKDYIKEIKNKRTDRIRPQYRFQLKENKKMTFSIFKKFILKYPFRSLQDLEAKLKKELFNNLTDEDSLEGLKQTNKNTRFLAVLNQIQDYWNKSQNNLLLEYQAKGKFTITD